MGKTEPARTIGNAYSPFSYQINPAYVAWIEGKLKDSDAKYKALEARIEGLEKDIIWRLEDIKEMLMSKTVGGGLLYGCDEWSTPVVNLDTAIKVIRNARIDK